jgi:hypothetical protein
MKSTEADMTRWSKNQNKVECQQRLEKTSRWPATKAEGKMKKFNPCRADNILEGDKNQIILPTTTKLEVF